MLRTGRKKAGHFAFSAFHSSAHIVSGSGIFRSHWCLTTVWKTTVSVIHPEAKCCAAATIDSKPLTKMPL